MKAVKTLPEGYRQTNAIDLVKNKKQKNTVMALSVVIALAFMALGWLIERFDPSVWTLSTWLVVIAAYCVYIVGHEAVHGLFMWLFSHSKPNFGFSFRYAYAGSEMYFAKTPYLIITLAPVIAWGILFGVLALALPAQLFWPVWALQIMNVSGAAGDLFVFGFILKMPDSTLVQDTGTAMTVCEKA